MDNERKRLTALERDALMKINLALSIVCNREDDLQKRTAMIKRGGFYLASARTMLEKYIENIYCTIPTEQLIILQRSIQEMTCTIGVRCAATKNAHIERDFGVIVPLGVINTLFSACTDHCVTCLKTSEDQRRCELKKALDTVPNDAKDRDDGQCPYGSML